MKVLVAAALAPFGSSPERELAAELADRLRRRGHRVELLPLPAWGATMEQVSIGMIMAQPSR